MASSKKKEPDVLVPYEDEILRRMLSTPPQPNIKQKAKRKKKKAR